MELEDLLRNSEQAKQTLTIENQQLRQETNALRKDLTTRMEEMREYASVCAKLEQSYSLLIEEHEKLNTEHNEQR